MRFAGGLRLGHRHLPRRWPAGRRSGTTGCVPHCILPTHSGPSVWCCRSGWWCSPTGTCSCRPDQQSAKTDRLPRGRALSWLSARTAAIIVHIIADYTVHRPAVKGSEHPWSYVPCPSRPVRPVLSCPSRPVRPVLSVPSCPSRPVRPVLSVPSCPSRPAIRSVCVPRDWRRGGRWQTAYIVICPRGAQSLCYSEAAYRQHDAGCLHCAAAISDIHTMVLLSLNYRLWIHSSRLITFMETHAHYSRRKGESEND